MKKITLLSPNGSKYHGIVSVGRTDGEFTSDAGEIYSGQFNGDRFHGFGVMIYQNADVYCGEWVDSMYHGLGEYVFASGNVYRGGWIQGKKHGIGEFKYADGSLYRGEYVDGKKHGTVRFVSVKGIVSDKVWAAGIETVQPCDMTTVIPRIDEGLPIEALL